MKNTAEMMKRTQPAVSIRRFVDLRINCPRFAVSPERSYPKRNPAGTAASTGGERPGNERKWVCSTHRHEADHGLGVGRIDRTLADRPGVDADVAQLRSIETAQLTPGRQAAMQSRQMAQNPSAAVENWRLGLDRDGRKVMDRCAGHGSCSARDGVDLWFLKAAVLRQGQDRSRAYQAAAGPRITVMKIHDCRVKFA